VVVDRKPMTAALWSRFALCLRFLQDVVQRPGATFAQISLGLCQQGHSAAAGREIFLNLAVPLLHVLLEEPRRQPDFPFAGAGMPSGVRRAQHDA
jgi:hypothetical protein